MRNGRGRPPGGGRGDGSRIQREARARRDRARRHLARVRSRDGEPPRSRRARKARPGALRRLLESPTRMAMGFLAAALAGGLFAASDLDRRLAGWWRDGATRLEAIAVQGNRRVAAAEIAAATGVARGQALESIDLDAVEARLREHPWLADARAATVPSGRLVVRVDERRPVALWSGDDGARWRWVDRDGVPFAEASAAEQAAWTRIVGGAGLAPEAAAPLLADAVALATEAHRRGIPGPPVVRLPDASRPDEGWQLEPRGLGLVAVLGPERARFGERLGRLARVLADESLAERRATRVDLRFSGRAFVRFAGAVPAVGEGPPRDGADTSGGGARMRDVVRTEPTG